MPPREEPNAMRTTKRPEIILSSNYHKFIAAMLFRQTRTAKPFANHRTQKTLAQENPPHAKTAPNHKTETMEQIEQTPRLPA